MKVCVCGGAIFQNCQERKKLEFQALDLIMYCTCSAFMLKFRLFLNFLPKSGGRGPSPTIFKLLCINIDLLCVTMINIIIKLYYSVFTRRV
jgi:uncharacterized membrane protein YhdT